MKMTSAYANKLLKRLNEDKNYWLSIEQERRVYVAAADEEAVVPDYDYPAVTAELAAIDAKVVAIKHAINLANVTHEIVVGDERLTIDAVLVRMAQLNCRKASLDWMRKQQPKSRVGSDGYFRTRPATPEYHYINYDPEQVKEDYAKVDLAITQMQIALDRFNQTVEFDVPV